jgi:hypothetical protein
MAIFVQRNSQRLGPYTVAEVRSQLASGALSLKDHVWWTGQEGWIPLVGSPVLAPGFEDPDPAMKKKGDGPTGLSPFSVAAVVSGLLFFMSFFTSVPAIVFGVCALDDLRKHPRRTGRRMAITGLALGIFFTLAWGAAVGWYYYDYDNIQAYKDREEAVNSDKLLPQAPTPAPSPAPAANTAPAPAANPAPTPPPATPAPANPGH